MEFDRIYFLITIIGIHFSGIVLFIYNIKKEKYKMVLSIITIAWFLFSVYVLVFPPSIDFGLVVMALVVYSIPVIWIAVIGVYIINKKRQIG